MKTSWQDQLHNLLNCDLKTLYPLARSLKRKLYFYVGPTNSGKTYSAMSELKSADCGIYLAPLRLLALEGYESLKEANIPVSLVTGEEQHFDEEAAHVCSTIEMIDFNMDVDVAIIDEVQMLDDIDRGWAWVNAIIGTPANKVIMTGSVNALDAVKKIAEYLGEELEIVRFKRKNPLEVLDKPINLRDLQPGTALIAFSRKNVLMYKERLQKYHKVSVIYGNLSPEVRRDEARRFRDKETDILIATDAIAMGLNLPIKTILFTTCEKFDGVQRRLISPSEIIQISGRAGRYGHHEKGHIGALNKKTLAQVQKLFETPVSTIKPPFKVKASAEQIEAIASHLQTTSLSKVLKFFKRNMSFSGPFVAANIASMIEASSIVDTKFNLKLQDKYMLSQAPMTTKSTIIKQAYEAYIAAVLKSRVVRYKPSITVPKVAKTQKDLLLVEDEVKKISLYLWLSYKLPNLFPDENKARMTRDALNTFIENSLKSNVKLASENREFQSKKRFPKRNSKARGNREKSRGNRKFNS
ncbi:helicase-related protein [Candidatus Marinarcus aquaticus]|uniref:RNA helicase n=1 Tax=Candidatus Marinarcus aquaticus TaxID=2044504 RepID=A0A4Q0XQI3_9BACT|nr:helicase-related protein [Candidatus Marinarcus aquaticus]RXJ53803.1 RNA helicase [Candidatus Marinarcus aquaticus]